MDMLERVVFPRMPVSTWSIQGNVLSLAVRGETLEEINDLVQEMQRDPIVEYCTVETASTQYRTANGRASDQANAELDAIAGNITAVLQRPTAGEGAA